MMNRMALASLAAIGGGILPGAILGNLPLARDQALSFPRLRGQPEDGTVRGDDEIVHVIEVSSQRTRWNSSPRPC